MNTKAKKQTNKRSGVTQTLRDGELDVKRFTFSQHKELFHWEETSSSSSSSVKKLNHRMRLTVIIPHPPIIRQDKKQHTLFFCFLIFFIFKMTVVCSNLCYFFFLPSYLFFKLEMSWHPPDSLSLADSLWRTHTHIHTTHRYTHMCWIMGGRV